MNAARAGCAFLRASATSVGLFDNSRRLGWLCLRSLVNRTLNHQRWLFIPAGTPKRHSKHQKRRRDQKTLLEVRPAEAGETLIAEPAAGPDTPAQAHDLVATLGTEIWTVSREERQICECPFAAKFATKRHKKHKSEG